jgi:hypothetical protein
VGNAAAMSQANLGGINDMENQQAIKNANVSGQLGEIGNAAANQASIYPLEQQVALQKGDPWNAWGSLLGSLGSLGMLAGGTGIGKISTAPYQPDLGVNAVINRAPYYNTLNNMNLNPVS